MAASEGVGLEAGTGGWMREPTRSTEHFSGTNKHGSLAQSRKAVRFKRHSGGSVKALSCTEGATSVGCGSLLPIVCTETGEG